LAGICVAGAAVQSTAWHVRKAATSPGRVALGVKGVVALHPVHIGVLGADPVVAHAQRLA